MTHCSRREFLKSGAGAASGSSAADMAASRLFPAWVKSAAQASESARAAEETAVAA